jgi:hypothetical protein
MIKKLWTAGRLNLAVVIVTFELFWIVVFLLDRIGQTGGTGVPDFVYVNF